MQPMAVLSKLNCDSCFGKAARINSQAKNVSLRNIAFARIIPDEYDFSHVFSSRVNKKLHNEAGTPY
jgi:hypothetical protein